MPEVRVETGLPAGAPELRVEPEMRRRIDEVRAAPHDAWRYEPLERKIAFARRNVGAVVSDATEASVDATLERIFNSPDFLAGWWLAAGVRRAAAVAKISTDFELGTGFMVSPWLMITNHHVLDSADTAGTASVQFRYEEDERGRIARSQKLAFQPERCFVTSPVEDLDFTLVAVEPARSARGDKPPGKAFGCIPMVGTVGKIVRGQPVNVVQHPSGRPREICVRNNLLVDILDEKYLLYGTDTEPGSSGSPVLNDHWELVALHCASEPRRNEQQQPLDVDGNVVTASTPESKRVWLANKGIRVSAIIRELSARKLEPSSGTEAVELVTELLRTGGNP
jgi:endonuclease G